MEGYHHSIRCAGSKGVGMSLEINYVDAPEGAQEKMNAVGEGANSLSDVSMVAKGARDIPYATLEEGLWKLDGTMRILPDIPNTGFWSQKLSETQQDSRLRDGTQIAIGRLGNFILGESRLGESSTGGFDTPPKIILLFPVPYSSTGFTFTFSPSTNQWCTEIRVAWYLGQVFLLEKTYSPNAPKWTLQETVESFDRVEIELISTNKPNQFAKVQKIEVGRTILLTAEEIVSARLVNEVDPSLCELTVDTMSFELYDPQNRGFLPQENQRIELIQDGRVRASHYITSSTKKSDSQYEIDCQSAIGLLSDEFLGGMYSDRPLEEMVSDILGNWDFEISSVFEKATITGYIPVCSQREALQRVAFAVGAMVSTQDSSNIRFLPIPKTVGARFKSSEILLGGSVKTASRYARVEVVSHSYTKSDIIETLMDEEEVNGEDVLITFTDPHYDYEITGGTITGSDVNWVKITANGPVTLNAKTYLHNTRTHVKRNPEATAKERGNYISVTECTLIHSGNAQDAVERLYSAKQWRQTVSQDVIVTGQKAGQIASSMTPWGTISRGFISSMESNLTQNGVIASIQIQGVEMKRESVWLYSGEIYSGGQEVVY